MTVEYPARGASSAALLKERIFAFKTIGHVVNTVPRRHNLPLLVLDAVQELRSQRPILVPPSLRFANVDEQLRLARPMPELEKVQLEAKWRLIALVQRNEVGRARSYPAFPAYRSM